MQTEQIHDALTRITQALADDAPDESLALARSLRHGMLQAPPVDPLLFGWARFYEIKSLYLLRRWAEALERMEGSEPAGYAMPQKNVAYLSSLASEMAYHLGQVDDVVRYGRRCLELRREAGDVSSMVQCASTVCHLLSELGRDELNTEFSLTLLEVARQSGAERPLLLGARRLLANVEKSGAPELRRRLAQLVDRLRQLHDDAWSGEAIELAGTISRSDWYLDALPERRRRALLCERALWHASESGDLGGVRALLDGGIAVDARDAMDRTALHHAAFAGHLPVVRLLLDRGAEVDATNAQRRTALVLAADQGHTAVVELLLDRGADPDRAGIFDQTALIVSSWQGHKDTVRLLLARGADPERVDVCGDTALTLTATEDQPEVVRALIAGGAAIDHATAAGHTALMKAAMEGRTRVARVLLELGADPRLRDEHGMDAAAWARQEQKSWPPQQVP